MDGAAFLSDPRKHLLHDAGFVIDAVKARVSTSFRLGHIPVAVGRMAEDSDTSLVRGVPRATPTPFEQFGSCVFCNDALHVQQQLIFRCVPQRTIQKDNLHPALRPCIEQQDLIGIMACEAIGTMHIEAIKPARRGHIT
jgi:hypothetical protein